MNVLFIGDIVSRAGRSIVKEKLYDIKQEFSIDFTIANAENVAGFRGLDNKSYEELSDAGVDVFTGGNHIWTHRNIFELIKKYENIVVPANFPAVSRKKDPKGKGCIVYQVGNTQVAVVNLIGRVYMDDVDCPFSVADNLLNQLDPQVRIRIVDFHAEATSEKVALGYYLDGRVSAFLGTHTHVQTADERVLADGTAYITDVGMTGPKDSVIGMRKDVIIDRFITGLPQKFEVAKTDPMISFVVVSINDDGRATAIKRYMRER